MTVKLYFRVRKNGAQVFRVGMDQRDKRMTLDPLATVVLRSGEIRVQGTRSLSEAERDEIEKWRAERQTTLAHRETDDLRRTIEAIQATAHWMQTKASDDAIRMVADDLLMALYDLRAATVRRLSDLD